MKATISGHDTVLLEMAGTRILTDPYFGLHGNLAYRRVAPPALSREELVNVDLVLLSHHHWDHVDRQYLRSLAPRVPVISPRGTAWISRLLGAKNAVSLGWWQSTQIGAVRITAVPALHLAISCGYMIEAKGQAVYFAGDTYYGSFMRKIGERFSIDLALMPVTSFLLPMTMREVGAVRATRALAPKAVIPIHLGLQPRSPLMRTADSPEGFAARVRQAGLPAEVVLLRNGQTWSATAIAETAS